VHKLYLALSVWFLTSLAGLATLAMYDYAPGLPAEQQVQEKSLSKHAGDYRLVCFIHPMCPCSAATLSELTEILERCSKINAEIYFFIPSNGSSHWRDSRVWRDAERLARCTVFADADGAQALKMGAHTSGQVFLFDSANRLVFQGGVTQGRGHVGFNAGTEAILEIAAGKEPITDASRVFGCALSNRTGRQVDKP